MSALDTLSAAAGRWKGTNRLHDPDTGGPDDSPGTATVTPLLGGRFVRLDYTWHYRGTSQEGSVLIGYLPKTHVATAHWIDSWHMSHVVMVCEGRADDRGVTVLGSYAAPPGPDWGWRTAITVDGDALGLVMHNIWPDGREEVAVEATYSRA